MLSKFLTTGLSTEEDIKSSVSCYPDSLLCPVPASIIVNFRLEKLHADVWWLMVTQFGGLFILGLTVLRVTIKAKYIHILFLIICVFWLELLFLPFNLS